MITTALYKGTIELVFNEDKHLFTIGGRKIISVTRFTSVIEKPALVPWAVGLTRDYLMANLKSLVEDTKGDRIVALIDESTKQHRIRKQEAADSGTLVHDWVEQFIKAKTKADYPETPKDPNVYNGVSAFLKWVDMDEVKFLASEKTIYSKKYDYAGILDAIAVIKHKKCVVDFKTSRAVYPEYFYQTSAYQGADEEESGEKYTGSKIIARFDKETGEFEKVSSDEQEKDYEVALACLTIRRRLDEMKSK
jgi:hypothetical protein